MPGKRVRLDEESGAALDLLARDRMVTFQELADEAFADVLKKHGRPIDRARAPDAPAKDSPKDRKADKR